jgi:bifunctional non-homologous end joining protein LigD
MNDPLVPYREKRNFDATPEPPGSGLATPRVAPHPTFMVHKHDARRLHYDLRLEIDGVLASWAIPQGPSTDPTQRRLAVETEDHPLEYGQFEGRIPDGQYGAGDALIWDRGFYDTLPPGQWAFMRKKGHLDLVLLGEKLQGRWHLVRTGKRGKGPEGPGAEWLFFKAADADANAGLDLVSTRPESVVSGRRITRGPILASVKARRLAPIDLLIALWPPCAPEDWTGAQQPTTETHILQTMPSGTRALASVSARRVAIQTDTGRDLAASHPLISQSLVAIDAHEAVFDGVVTDETRYCATDLLWLDNRDLRQSPLEERLELLASVLPTTLPTLALPTLVPVGSKSEETYWARRHGSTVGAAGSWMRVTLPPVSPGHP